MIHIDKSNTPAVFTEIKRKYRDYDELHETDKTPLKAILIKEQGELCAYCMCRISEKTSTIEHYIPRHGEHGDISLSLDYRNLFAVCERTRMKKSKDKTCDDKKGDRLLVIDPRKKGDIEQVKYKTDGTIYSGQPTFENDLNDILNLNEVTLRSNRRAAVEEVLRQLHKRKSGTWNKDYLRKILNTYATASPKKEYVGAIIYRLRKRLEQG